MRVIRVLIYEGTDEAIDRTIARSATQDGTPFTPAPGLKIVGSTIFRSSEGVEDIDGVVEQAGSKIRQLLGG